MIFFKDIKLIYNKKYMKNILSFRDFIDESSGTTIHDINDLFKEDLSIKGMEMFSISIKRI